MIDSADISLLAAVLLISLSFQVQARRELTRHDAKTYQYKFYAVRDRLIHLVAKKKLAEDSFIFNYFYKATNFYIHEVDRLTLRNVVKAISAARHKGLDPASENKIKEIHSALRRADPEVKEAVNAFYLSQIEILVQKSFLLRMLVKYHWLRSITQQIQSRLNHKIKRQFTIRKAYRFYSEYDKAIDGNCMNHA